MSPSAATRVEWGHRLAQTLVAGGYVPEEVIAPLVSEADQSATPLGKLLISRQVASPQVVVSSLAQLAQLQAVDLYSERPEPAALALVPAALAAEYGVVGFREAGGQLVLACAEPPDAEDMRTLSTLIGRPVSAVLADPLAIERVLVALSSVGPSDPGSPQGQPQAQMASQGQPQPHVQAQAQPAPPGAGVAAPAASPHSEAGEAGGGPGGSPNGHGSAPGGHSSDSGEPVFHGGQGDVPLHIDDLLRYAVEVGASDLHLTARKPGSIRLHGAIRPIEGCPKLDNETIREMVFGILPQSLRERFEEEKELDTSHSIAGVGRFRLNVFMQRGTVAAVMRSIPHEIPSFESLGIPESIRSFTEMRSGLVLVTGPTGSGKSTTLATLIDIINRTKPLHIISIEDPIEFLHNHKRSVVNQREVGQDTKSFAEALRRVLREDPDVILVGEMRDLETISMALTAAETGHLVFATLHTQDAPQTIDRIVDVFPTSQQEQIRTQLAASLEGVVTQQLILNADGTGRLACCEVMLCTSAIRNLVRSAKTHQIYSLMQTGAQYGMQTMDQGLAKLVKEGRITEAVAFDRCRSEEDLRNHLAS